MTFHSDNNTFGKEALMASPVDVFINTSLSLGIRPERPGSVHSLSTLLQELDADWLPGEDRGRLRQMSYAEPGGRRQRRTRNA